MSPLIFFDYIYYTVSNFYANKFGYEEEKEYVGTLFLSMFQLFNVITLINLFKPLKEFSIFDPVFIYAGILILLIIINLIRYYKIVEYKVLTAKWGKENGVARTVKVGLVIFYFIITLIFFIKSA